MGWRSTLQFVKSGRVGRVGSKINSSLLLQYPSQSPFRGQCADPGLQVLTLKSIFTFIANCICLGVSFHFKVFWWQHGCFFFLHRLEKIYVYKNRTISDTRRIQSKNNGEWRGNKTEPLVWTDNEIKSLHYNNDDRFISFNVEGKVHNTHWPLHLIISVFQSLNTITYLFWPIHTGTDCYVFIAAVFLSPRSKKCQLSIILVGENSLPVFGGIACKWLDQIVNTEFAKAPKVPKVKGKWLKYSVDFPAQAMLDLWAVTASTASCKRQHKEPQCHKYCASLKRWSQPSLCRLMGNYQRGKDKS